MPRFVLTVSLLRVVAGAGHKGRWITRPIWVRTFKSRVLATLSQSNQWRTMTRILYWNVEKFSLPKIDDTETQEKRLASGRRLRHIIKEVIHESKPQIVVIVELVGQTREETNEGTVIGNGTNVTKAILQLLEELRLYYKQEKTSAEWALIPPIWLGSNGFREAVAVMYDSAVLRFAGPWLHTIVDGGSLRRSSAPSTESRFNMVEYESPWREAMPSGRSSMIKISDEYESIREECLAGQWEYFNGETRVKFPDKTKRSPYLTCFVDLGSKRAIKLFAVHTSPKWDPGKAVEELANVKEIQNVSDNEVSVIVGDFNVDSFNNLGPYQGLLNLRYQMALHPRNPMGVVAPARKPYCLTHLLPAKLATPFNNNRNSPADPQHNVYPRFGYMGSTDLYGMPVDSGAIDNIFTRYGRNLTRPEVSNITVVNTVVGKPYQAPNPAVPDITGELTGGLTFQSSLANEIPVPNGRDPVGPDDPKDPDHPDNVVATFLDSRNFGTIRSTSDHLALVIDV